MKSSTVGSLGFLPHRKHVYRATGRARRRMDPLVCQLVQWRGRHHCNNAFRWTVLEDRPPALALVSILLLLRVPERVSTGIGLQRIYPARGQTTFHAIFFFLLPQAIAS